MGDWKRMRGQVRELKEKVSELEEMKGVSKKDCKCKLVIKNLNDEVKRGEEEKGDLMDKLVGLQTNYEGLMRKYSELEKERDELAEELKLVKEKLSVIDDIVDDDEDIPH